MKAPAPGSKEADVVRLRLRRYVEMNAPPKVAGKTKAAAPVAAQPKEPAMVKKSKRAKTTKKPRPSKAKAKTEAAPAVRSGTKLEVVAGLLTRPEGCTAADVLAATGWPTLSFNQQAKAAHLTLRKVKEGRVSRYFGTPAG